MHMYVVYVYPLGKRPGHVLLMLLAIFKPLD